MIDKSATLPLECPRYFRFPAAIDTRGETGSRCVHSEPVRRCPRNGKRVKDLLYATVIDHGKAQIRGNPLVSPETGPKYDDGIAEGDTTVCHSLPGTPFFP